MADFSAILRQGVSIANTVTDSLQVDVTYRAWTGQDGFGKPTFADAVTKSCILDSSPRIRTTTAGREYVQEAEAIFLEPFTANGAALRSEPFDLRDEVTLPSGKKPVAIEVLGIADPSTNLPYMITVRFGRMLTV